MKEFASFVASIESTLLLKNKCDLINVPALRALLVFGEGLLGEIVELLKLLAEASIRSGDETINAAMITKQNLQELGWVMPSDRSRHFE